MVGDIGEAVAIRKAIGDHVVLTAPKSALGHLVGGAGAVESIITLLSIYHGIIPATRNLENQDPKVELDVVAGEPRKMELTAADQRLVRLRRAQRGPGLHGGLTDDGLAAR